MQEAEAELVAGYNIEYASMGFALFFLGEYANIERGNVQKVSPGTMVGRMVFSSASCAKPLGLPPRIMSVPLPAMLVAMVIRPGTPACTSFRILSGLTLLICPGYGL